ncbi:MAG TPA: response regulator [Pyrinomonadaceae bacterium]|jgi:DNA-binding response OmpR family regulator
MNEKSPHRVLIIEDDPDSAESLKMLLEINNYTVDFALDGESGLDKAVRFEPQIVVCDIGLPGKVNGLQFAETLRRNEKTRAVYLIALSGYGQSEDVSEAKMAGFDDYLVKPVDFDKLIKLIEKYKTVSK